MEPNNGYEAAAMAASPELDVSSVRSGESMDNREPEAESVPSFVPLPEAVESAPPLSFAQPRSFVGDAQFSPAVDGAGRKRDRRAGRRRVDCVGEEVVENLLNAPGRGERCNLALELHMQVNITLGRERRPGLDSLFDERAERDR